MAVQITTCRGQGHIVEAPLQAAQLVFRYNFQFLSAFMAWPNERELD